MECRIDEEDDHYPLQLSEDNHLTVLELRTRKSETVCWLSMGCGEVKATSCLNILLVLHYYCYGSYPFVEYDFNVCLF